MGREQTITMKNKKLNSTSTCKNHSIFNENYYDKHHSSKNSSRLKSLHQNSSYNNANNSNSNEKSSIVKVSLSKRIQNSSSESSATVSDDSQEMECPLCLEHMDDDDLAFYPCTICNYQICGFCWDRLINEANDDSRSENAASKVAQCPNCREPYDESNVLFCKTSRSSTQRNGLNANNMKAGNENERSRTRSKVLLSSSQVPNVKGGEEGSRSSSKSGGSTVSGPLGGVSGGGFGGLKKPSSNCRVVLRHLLFIQGVPVALHANAEKWTKQLFGGFGAIERVIFTHTNSPNGESEYDAQVNGSGVRPQQRGTKGDTCGAFVTYVNADDSMEALVALDGYQFQLSLDELPTSGLLMKERASICSRTYQIRVFLGTSKYCQNFLNGRPCNRRGGGRYGTSSINGRKDRDLCMYMHETGDVGAIFTKDEISIGMHLKYQEKLVESFVAKKKERLAAIRDKSVSISGKEAKTNSGVAASSPNKSRKHYKNKNKTPAWSQPGSKTVSQLFSDSNENIRQATTQSKKSNSTTNSSSPTNATQNASSSNNDRDSGCCSSASGESPQPQITNDTVESTDTNETGESVFSSTNCLFSNESPKFASTGEYEFKNNNEYFDNPLMAPNKSSASGLFDNLSPIVADNALTKSPVSSSFYNFLTSNSSSVDSTWPPQSSTNWNGTNSAGTTQTDTALSFASTTVHTTPNTFFPTKINSQYNMGILDSSLTTTSSQLYDDIGFDPWRESNKALSTISEDTNTATKDDWESSLQNFLVQPDSHDEKPFFGDMQRFAIA